LNHPQTFDAVIIGGGFAGSLCAAALQKQGLSVLLVEKGSHPRFAVGESSTPLADMSLRRIASRFDLPWLSPLSRFGSWQKKYPTLLCGRKRGFTYVWHGQHQQENPFLVAASSTNDSSDTQWLRQDVDRFLCDRAVDEGVTYWDFTEVLFCEHLHASESSDEPKPSQTPTANISEKRWQVTLMNKMGIQPVYTDWIVDATGSVEFSSHHLGVTHSSSSFNTHTSAIYSHFEEMPLWFHQPNDYLYPPDFSALHHLLDEGWLWMLRFENQRLSVGLVLEGESNPGKERWDEVLSRYPELELFLSQRVQPSDLPAQWMTTGRIQRRADSAVGDGWVLLPHSYGFVDPMHSTGLAHTLHGVERVVEGILMESTHDQNAYFQSYQRSLKEEITLIDHLVAISLRCRHHPELFKAATMAYFVCTVSAEQDMVAKTTEQQESTLMEKSSSARTSFLSAHRPEFQTMASDIWDMICMEDAVIDLLRDQQKTHECIQEIIEIIRPFDTIGLFDYVDEQASWKVKSQIPHTAVSF
jgi:FADH2 O2-dependent halogenase